RGREALTHFTVMERYPASVSPSIASLMECRLETGRTHQIRAHLTELGHPLLGDGLYGSSHKIKATLLDSRTSDALTILGRQALHSRLLGFEHPVTGERLVFESPLPPELQCLHDALAAFQ